MRRANSIRWSAVYADWQILQTTYKDQFDKTIHLKSRNLQIYWKQRTKEQQFLFNALLTNITKKKLRELTEEEWRLDGFEPQKDKIGYPNNSHWMGYDWFAKTYDFDTLVDCTNCAICEPDCGKLFYENEIRNPKTMQSIGDFEVYIIEFKRED